MKIALAQINPIVGDLQGNSRKIVDMARQAHAQGTDLAVFPELCVIGYPPQDLLENPSFLEAARYTTEHIATLVPPDLGIILGTPVRNTQKVGKRFFNAAFLYEGGQCLAEVHKTLLPTYDVFDEYRHFEPAQERRVVEWRGLKLGLHICEDLWNNQAEASYYLYHLNPIDELAAQGADVLINISASPFAIHKHDERTRLIQDSCREHRIPYLFVNQVGANTEIIFDGDSRVHGPDGTPVLCAPQFEEALLLWDTDAEYAACTTAYDDVKNLHDALVMGIRDYFYKTGAFKKALVGLSGGIDSAVTCALAANALGSDKVVGVTMPSKYSSTGSVSDSEALAQNLGIAFHTIPIKPAVAAFDDMLADVFRGTTPGVAEENIQARARGVTLMALSNKFGYLLLSTGNKSEMAVGYATLYGDMNGGLAVLSDVLKTRVYRLAQYINERAGRTIIPENTITKPPSAELRPDQQDADSLPPYPVLDEILRRYIEEQEEVDTIVANTGIERALVQDILRRVDLNEYKRRQAPPGLRVTMKAFGIGRRLPIVMRWDRTTTVTVDERE